MSKLASSFKHIFKENYMYFFYRFVKSCTMFVKRKALLYQLNYPRELLRSQTEISEGPCSCVKHAEFSSMYIVLEIYIIYYILLYVNKLKWIHVSLVLQSIHVTRDKYF